MATEEEEKQIIEQTLREKEHDRLPNDNENPDVEGNATDQENENDGPEPVN